MTMVAVPFHFCWTEIVLIHEKSTNIFSMIVVRNLDVVRKTFWHKKLSFNPFFHNGQKWPNIL